MVIYFASPCRITDMTRLYVSTWIYEIDVITAIRLPIWIYELIAHVETITVMIIGLSGSAAAKLVFNFVN